MIPPWERERTTPRAVAFSLPGHVESDDEDVFEVWREAA